MKDFPYGGEVDYANWMSIPSTASKHVRWVHSEKQRRGYWVRIRPRPKPKPKDE